MDGWSFSWANTTMKTFSYKMFIGCLVWIWWQFSLIWFLQVNSSNSNQKLCEKWFPKFVILVLWSTLIVVECCRRKLFWFGLHSFCQSYLLLTNIFNGLFMFKLNRNPIIFWHLPSRVLLPERQQGRISSGRDISLYQWTTSWIWFWGHAPTEPCFWVNPAKILIFRE